MCRDIPGQCAKSQVPPTMPPNVSIPDPLPEPSRADIVQLVAIESSAAQCQLDTTSGTSTNCTLEQECHEFDLLTQHIGGTGLSISALYFAAFSIFNENSLTRSVHTLLHEFNYRSTIQCAGNFSEFNDTAFQVTQADGSGVFEYFLPVAQTPGHPRTLQNSQVDVTLPNLGTLGDLRLRYFFDWSGDVETVQRFIRPPNQATDLFFPFPLRETVSAVWLAYDQYLK